MDEFYDLKNNSVENVRKCLQWAKDKAAAVDLHVLNCGVSPARKIAKNVTFDQLIEAINKNSASFFRVVVRRGCVSAKFIMPEGYRSSDYIEVVIRSIYLTKDKYNPNEYFIFCYLDIGLLEEIQREWSFLRI